MDFNHFLTSYMPDPKIGSKIHFDNIKLSIWDVNKRMFFRDLRNTINQHLGEELINLINVDIEDDKLDYSFNEWWREQGEDQRRTPSLVLRSA